MEPTKAGGGLPLDPAEGFPPWTPTKGGAFWDPSILVGVRKGGEGRLGCRLRSGDQPVRRAAARPAPLPLPHPNQRAGSKGSALGGGSKGQSPPLAGVRGRSPPSPDRLHASPW